MGAVPAIKLIHGADGAQALMHPMRRRILEELREPDSATGIARRLGLKRQQVNYHLRELEKQGLVDPVEERRKGNCIERVVRATARYYVIDPQVLGSLAADPAHIRDRFSSAYLVASLARGIRELAELRKKAAEADKSLATLTLETEVRFASPTERKAFTEELAGAVARLVNKYHDADSEQGRSFRYLIGAWPAIPRPEQTDE